MEELFRDLTVGEALALNSALKRMDNKQMGR